MYIIPSTALYTCHSTEKSWQLYANVRYLNDQITIFSLLPWQQDHGMHTCTSYHPSLLYAVSCFLTISIHLSLIPAEIQYHIYKLLSLPPPVVISLNHTPRVHHMAHRCLVYYWTFPLLVAQFQWASLHRLVLHAPTLFTTHVPSPVKQYNRGTFSTITNYDIIGRQNQKLRSFLTDA